MRVARHLPLVALALVIGAPRAHAITFGEDDGTDHPNVGAMILDFDDIGSTEFHGYGEECTVTLIAPRAALTAAHCTVDLEALGYPYGDYDLYVSFDPDPDFKPGTWTQVSAIVTNPDYQQNGSGGWTHMNDPHDIAILVLDQAVANIQPATLPEVGFLDALRPDLGQGANSADFLAVGYGGQITYPPPQTFYLDTRWRALMGYQTLLNAWLVTSQNPHRGDGGTCYGDSGGPVFWVDASGNLTLVALTSWGDEPCVAEGFYYRTDIPGSVDFINGVLDAIQAGDFN